MHSTQCLCAWTEVVHLRANRKRAVRRRGQFDQLDLGQRCTRRCGGNHIRIHIRISHIRCGQPGARLKHICICLQFAFCFFSFSNAKQKFMR